MKQVTKAIWFLLLAIIFSQILFNFNETNYYTFCFYSAFLIYVLNKVLNINVDLNINQNKKKKDDTN